MTTTFDILQKYINIANKIDREQILDDWSADVLDREDYLFETGLLGLGWLINYLIHEKYMDGNADEILEDIDDTIYKLTIKEVTDECVDIGKLLYLVTYYQQRLTYNSRAHFYRKFTHYECLKLLLQKLNDFLLHKSLDIKDVMKDKIDVLLKYSFLIKTCVNENLVEEAFYHACESIIEYSLKDLCNISLVEIYKLGLVVKQYSHPYWENKIKNLISMQKNDSSFYFKVIFDRSESSRFILSDKDISDLFKSLTNYEIFFLITNIKFNNDV